MSTVDDERSACSWRVRQAVRVHSADRAIARRGIISVVHSLPTSIDVIYEKPLKNVNTAETSGDEEERVDVSRISVLLDFESHPSIDVSSAFVLKSNANTLFGLRDYQSSLDLYKKAMDRLVGGIPIEIGCLVLVSYSDSVDVRTGMIADLDASVYDVMLDANNGQPHSDDEAMVTADRLLVLALSPADRWLQRSLYLNMARCASKLSLKGWAVKYASIALAISSFQSVAHPDAASTTASINTGISLGASNSDSVVDVAGLLADCLYFRGRSLLNACRPQMARKDCIRLANCDPSRAASLSADIDRYRLQLAKSNRKLARDIASWVSVTVQGQSSRSHDECDCDIDVLSEGDKTVAAETGPWTSMGSVYCLIVFAAIVALIAIQRFAS